MDNEQVRQIRDFVKQQYEKHRNGFMMHASADKDILDFIDKLMASEDEVSKDERIKKIITDSVFYQYGAGVEYEDVLDYLDRLEKQKPSFRQIHDSIIWDDGLRTGIELGKKEQKPEERFEEAREKYQVEWSEEDKEIITNATKQLYSYADSYHNASNYTREKEIRKVAYELKSLHPQPKQEWSEEDEINRVRALFYVRHYQKTNGDTDGSKECADWLKFLRPQPHTVSIKDATKLANLEYERGVKDGIQSEKSRQWKPTEEQMDSLRDTMVQTKGYSYSVYLPELYEQLKKL